MMGLAFCIAAFTVSAAAQSNTFPASGNVGIGTTSPGVPLEVHGPAYLGINNWDTQLSSPQLVLRLFSNGISGIAPYSAFDFKTVAGFYFNNKLEINSWDYAYGQSSALLTLQGDGNVGIGTTNPQAKLHVVTSSASTNSWIGTTATGAGSIAGFLIGGADGVFTGGDYWELYQLQSSLKTLYLDGPNPNVTGTPQLVLLQGGGNVGIGTTAPVYPLDVAGQIHSSGGIVFPDGSVQTTATGQALSANNAIAQSNGNVGIGTTTPAYKFDVSGNSGSGPAALIGLEDVSGATGARNWAIGNSAGSVPYGSLGFYVGSTIGGAIGTTPSMILLNSGNVGIGTTNPAAKLDVNGGINISGAGAGITFPNGGGTQTVAWTGTACGGDYAESVDVSGDRTHYEPGDLLVIDPNAPGKFLKSMEPYSTLVSGIYSTKPGLVGRRQAGDPKSSTTEIPMAMVGIVPTKVSAENGPIRTGDLLVASATMGHAMKGTDRSLLTGAVIGKALGNLDSGTGVIEVLVTLQ
jgi:hypothetical protein